MQQRLEAAGRHQRRRRRRRRGAHPSERRRRESFRLLFRAGFGPRPGDVERLARLDRKAAVYSLTRPRGAARLSGPEPHISDGTALAPTDRDGHDHLWWFDRMVRSDQPLVERLTLIFHDWFATSNEKVSSQTQMIAQNNLIRQHALGSFATLFHDLSVDPAMLIWLDGTSNHSGDVNENFAREMMELFSLGADRGAYSERDVREQARALTGFTNDSTDQGGTYNFRFDDSLHDHDSKTVFAKTGDFGWEDAVRMCVTHPLHPSFFVTKLWSYFMPAAPDRATVARLSRIYTVNRYSIRAVVEAILLDGRLYSGPAMVKPPLVHAAGILRALRRGVDNEAWVDLATQSGQRLFYPPNVSGWTKDRWLDTSTYKARWDGAALALGARALSTDHPPAFARRPQSPEAAVSAALAALGSPQLTRETRDYLRATAARLGGSAARASAPRIRAMRQNALRHLIVTCPDYQTC